LPEAIVTPYGEENVDNLVKKGLECADGVVIGCGFGTTETSYRVLQRLLYAIPTEETVPLVMDADALNLLAAHPELWQAVRASERVMPTVITPHPMEMARLCGTSVSDVLENPIEVARAFASKHSVVVVLKGAYTVIADACGKTRINVHGNAGMATGGSGDVLAGVLGSLLVQNRRRLEKGMISAIDVVAAGVALHAMAADHAVLSVGEYGLCAGDIVKALPWITRSLSDTRTVLSYMPYKKGDN
jgi:NAD(P)H-hydrate epimerase